MLEIFTEEKLSNIINDYLSRLKNKINIDQVILFGSYAKGTATELSDIDLLIVSRDLSENVPKGKNGFYLDNLAGKFNPSLEVIGVNPKQLDNPIEKGFFEEIITTGKTIFSKDIGKHKAA